MSKVLYEGYSIYNETVSVTFLFVEQLMQRIFI